MEFRLYHFRSLQTRSICGRRYPVLFCQNPSGILQSDHRSERVSIFHIPVGSLNTPHQKILSFFACKVVDHLHGCFRIFTILGDRDCIPAKCTSSGVSSFICTDSVSKDFIGIEFCIFSYRRSKCCICCIGIPVGSKGTEYVACRQFLRPLIFLVDNPLFVQKASVYSSLAKDIISLKFGALATCSRLSPS